MMLTVVLILGVLYNTGESVCKSEDTLSEAEKAVLKIHNEFRDRHIDTNPLCYGESVSFTAQSYAEKLAKKADSYAYRTWRHSNSDFYGENIYVYYSGESPSIERNWVTATEEWYKEIESWRGDNVCRATGHFTQLVWKATTELNCGHATNEWDHNVVVCQYHPPGNIEGQYDVQVPKLKKVWRDDGRCGDNFLLDIDSGPVAECNANSRNPCCSADNTCGGSDFHCGEWRSDDKCGSDWPLAFGAAAKCNPNHPEGYSCCNATIDGQCGNTRDHCECDDCVEHGPTELQGAASWTQWPRDDSSWMNFHLYNNPLEVTTDKPLGSDEIMTLGMGAMGDAGNIEDAGGFTIKLSDPAVYKIALCTDFTPFPSTLPNPSVDSRIWKFTKRSGTQMTVHCNGKQVLDFDLAVPETCTKGKDKDWPSIWDKRVIKMSFTGSAGIRYRKARELECPPKKILCADVKTCIHEDRVCDGYYDCPSGTEEDGCKVWRDDGLCGFDNKLPNGFPAQCDENSLNPCCSDGVCVPDSPDKCDLGCIQEGDNKGEDYRGKIAVTKSGRICQRWDAQWPRIHTRTAANFPDSGLEENYCRNPDGEPGPWCYNSEGILPPRYELCAVPKCSGN